jgi:hypothetical protein
MAGRKRYIISMKLVESDGIKNTPVAETGLWRTYNEGEAKVIFDTLVKQLKDGGWSFDNDSVSKLRYGNGNG